MTERTHVPRHLCLRCWWHLFAQQVSILLIVLTLYLVFGGEPDDEDAIDNDDDDDGSSDGNQFNDHRHIAMILWPGYFDTEVSFTQH